jgi:hypothetical protein
MTQRFEIVLVRQLHSSSRAFVHHLRARAIVSPRAQCSAAAHCEHVREVHQDEDHDGPARGPGLTTCARSTQTNRIRLTAWASRDWRIVRQSAFFRVLGR